MGYSGHTFSRRLSEKRASAGLGWDDLSALSGLPPVLIGQLEKGTSAPSLDAACALAVALGCSIDELAGLPLPADRKQSA